VLARRKTDKCSLKLGTCLWQTKARKTTAELAGYLQGRFTPEEKQRVASDHSGRNLSPSRDGRN